MAVNLAEDWKRRFGTAAQKAAHEIEELPVVKKMRPMLNRSSKVVAQKEEEEPEIDIVSDVKPARKTNKPDKETWENNVDIKITEPQTRPKVIHRTEPVVTGRKVYVSNGTAQWALVRAGTYPMYKQWCESLGSKPDLVEFNSILAPQWRALSPEDKVRASQNPQEFFIFE